MLPVLLLFVGVQVAASGALVDATEAAALQATVARVSLEAERAHTEAVAAHAAEVGALRAARANPALKYARLSAPLDLPVLGRGKPKTPVVASAERTGEMLDIIAEADERSATVTTSDGQRMRRSVSVFEPGDSATHPNPEQVPTSVVAILIRCAFFLVF